MFSFPLSLASLLMNRFLWKVVIAVVALVSVYYWGYNRGYEAGVNKMKVEVQAVSLERDSWKHDFLTLQSEIKAKAKAWAAALAEQQAEHERVLSEISIKLERFRRENSKLKGELSDTKRFVSVAADSACVVPVGFIWLHDAAASGSSAGIPASPTPGAAVNADAASGVALSQVAEVAVHNYSLAREWRVQLIAWQDWYGQWQAWYAEWTARQQALDKPPPGR